MNFTLLTPANATNCTFHSPDENGSSSSDGTLSAGSAAFISIALIFGCMTQLPGSLVTGEANRFWRISPFLCMAETLVIMVRITKPLFNSICTQIRRHLVPERFAELHLDRLERQGRVSLKVQSYALLAERLGNSRKYNYWLRQQWKESAPTVEQIVELLDEVSNLERGSTLRPIVIIPMILQFAKVLIIDADWISVKLLPWIYFWSWFSVEGLLLMVHGGKLSEMDMLEAERILLLSVAPTEIGQRPGQTSSRRAPTQAPSVSTVSNGGTGGTSTLPELEPLIELEQVAGQETSQEISPQTLNPPAGAPDSASIDLEQQDRETQVVAQTRALLAHAVGSDNIPHNRITFRGGRRKLSTMQGKGSNSFYQTMFGVMAVMLESVYSAILIPITFGDSIPTWVVVLVYVSVALLFPLMMLDSVIGAVIAGVAEWWMGRPWEHYTSATRDWGAFRAMVFILVYYAAVYVEDGTSKPAWLDWLG
ncbi:hypothetical protein B0T25DRAFT_617977 [Lasiosphaeria hispida]|uniref:Uncharacterized protein n=1 Tax=Lasiosphaeria hispida TaxID=260671 RepID=A0AAJ0H8G8_9PEZI|nr:hypothetical protein B0T25DRAFT_617977 [Lasiosphaeria hispida]